MVFYRKYRPQKISELDSLEVKEKLFSIFPASPAGGSKDSPHAFLLTGSKGLGKTSTARIIAKVVNCERNSKFTHSTSSGQNSKIQVKSQKLTGTNSKDPGLKTNDQIEPCNECVQCVSITNGTNLDVLEIDGASNRGIDEIRDLREKIRLAPLSSTKKVYIIDEVHMLTTEAFNALLKTLEEPPSHAIFILCTTELHKVPETITSRCFHVPFRQATEEELVSSFKRIVKGENFNIEPVALQQIAKLADGSFRDGAKILEELAFLADGKTITVKLLEEKYQISNTKNQIAKMFEFLVQKDTKGAIELISKLVTGGIDMKYFIEQMINVLHEELLVKVGVEQSSKFKVQSSKLTVEEIKRLVELLMRAHGELKYAVLPQLPLELVILEYTQVQNNADQNHVILVSEVHPGSDEDSGQARMTLTEKSHEKTPRTTTDIWGYLIEKVKKHNHSIAGVLRGCLLKAYNNKELIIEAKYKFHKDRLMEPKTLEILEKAWEELVEKKVKVVVELRR